MGKTVRAVETSPGGAYSSRNCHLEECTLLGDVATVHTVFLIYTTRVPVNFTQVMPFSLEKSHYTLLLFTC